MHEAVLVFMDLSKMVVFQKGAKDLRFYLFSDRGLSDLVPNMSIAQKNPFFYYNYTFAPYFGGFYFSFSHVY